MMRNGPSTSVSSSRGWRRTSTSSLRKNVRDLQRVAGDGSASCAAPLRRSRRVGLDDRARRSRRRSAPSASIAPTDSPCDASRNGATRVPRSAPASSTDDRQPSSVALHAADERLLARAVPARRRDSQPSSSSTSSGSPPYAKRARWSGGCTVISRPAAITATRSHDDRLADVLRRAPRSCAPRSRSVAEVLPEPLAQDRVDARGRLVEEQQLRVVHEGRGERQPALHAARAVRQQLVPVLRRGRPGRAAPQRLPPAPQRHAVHRRDERQVAPDA